MATCEPIRGGYPNVELVNYLFGVCIYSPQEKISFALGAMSILCFATAQFPQIFLTCFRRSSRGVSYYFVLMVLSAHSLRFFSLILLGPGLITQICLASYFVLVDIVYLVEHYLFGTLKRQFLIPVVTNTIFCIKYCLRKNNSTTFSQTQEEDFSEDNIFAPFLKTKSKSKVQNSETRRENVGSFDFAAPQQPQNEKQISKQEDDHHNHNLVSIGSDEVDEEELEEANLKSDDALEENNDQQENHTLQSISLLFVFLVAFSAISKHFDQSSSSNDILKHQNFSNSRRLMAFPQLDLSKINNLTTFEKQCGFVLAILATFCDIFSTIPQILHNFYWRSTSGLTNFWIGMIIAGEILSIFSIILFSFEPYYVLYQLPVIFASLISIALNISLIAQHVVYGWIVPLTCPKHWLCRRLLPTKKNNKFEEYEVDVGSLLKRRRKRSSRKNRSKKGKKGPQIGRNINLNNNNNSYDALAEALLMSEASQAVIQQNLDQWNKEEDDTTFDDSTSVLADDASNFPEEDEF